MNHTSIFHAPDLKKIPNHALTHYVCDIYPIKPVVQKIVSGHARKTQIQRKVSKKEQPIIASVHAVKTSRETFNPKMPRNAFRKDIDKAALNEYFDNDVIATLAEQKQENLAAMVDELDIADAIEYEMKITSAEEIRAFVESVRVVPQPTIPAEHTSIWDDDDEYPGINWLEEYIIAEKYNPIMDTYHSAKHRYLPWKYKEEEPKYIGINSIDATQEDKFERLFFENEINAHKVDIFEKKIARSNQMHGMIRLHRGQFRHDKRNKIYKDFLARQR